jgi:hypothetical protein
MLRVEEVQIYLRNTVLTIAPMRHGNVSSVCKVMGRTNGLPENREFSACAID